ncbi:hypothetical protein [uncultured Ruminococcus sp.]|uniref:hypothetical protein n=1 Tax=uncultured Ruminococcus sp. TaxID=165186 RepID=UPI0025F2FA5C|nr:hypothetical protein [uncultured Ruminococcus sp.]
MKRMSIIAVLMISTVLASCGKSNEGTATESKPAVTTAAETVTTTAESKAATTKTTEPSSEDSTVNSNDERTTAADDNSEKIGVDRATAVSNVKQLAGSGANIVSVTEGTSPEGFKCWIVVVEPVTTENGPDTVTYYSGYQFCYPENKVQQDGKQNPLMNYIGKYSNGRAIMNVSCIGTAQASIVITWSGNVTDSSVWTMSGNVTSTTEAVTVTYNNCTKESVSYASDGSNMSNMIEYTDGSGTIKFMAADNKAYWYDSQENASDGVPFSYYNE